MVVEEQDHIEQQQAKSKKKKKPKRKEKSTQFENHKNDQSNGLLLAALLCIESMILHRPMIPVPYQKKEDSPKLDQKKLVSPTRSDAQLRRCTWREIDDSSRVLAIDALP